MHSDSSPLQSSGKCDLVSSFLNGHLQGVSQPAIGGFLRPYGELAELMGVAITSFREIPV